MSFIAGGETNLFVGGDSCIPIRTGKVVSKRVNRHTVGCG